MKNFNFLQLVVAASQAQSLVRWERQLIQCCEFENGTEYYIKKKYSDICKVKSCAVKHKRKYVRTTKVPLFPTQYISLSFISCLSCILSQTLKVYDTILRLTNLEAVKGILSAYGAHVYAACKLMSSRVMCPVFLCLCQPYKNNNIEGWP